MIIEKGVNKAELLISHQDWVFLYANPQITEIILTNRENLAHIIKVIRDE